MGVKEIQKRVAVTIIALVFIALFFVGLMSVIFKVDSPKYDIDEINKGGDWKQVTDEIFISKGSYVSVNMVLVVSKGEVALIDTGANKTEGLRVKEYIEDNNLIVNKIFLTHKHSDHIANLSMFEVSRENIYDFANTTDNQIIKMGDRSFKILYTPGHSNDNHISIELIEDKILVAGDVVPTCAAPLISYGGDSITLKKTLERIKKSKYSLIIPGHGNLFETKRTVEIQLEYLKKARALVKELILSGKSVQDAKKIKLIECVDGTTGFTSIAQAEHRNTISKLYYEVKAEIKKAKEEKD